jgi:hypothetical protein
MEVIQAHIKVNWKITTYTPSDFRKSNYVHSHYQKE